MGSIQKRPTGKWRARIRDASGREHTRHFALRRDAERWIREQATALASGDWVAPERGRLPFGEFAQEWLARQVHLKPSTRARYEGILRTHILPRWSRRPLSRMDYDDVARWVADLSASGLSASSVRQNHRVLSLVLAEAVKSKRVARNVAEGVTLPRVARRERRFLTADEVHRLADASGDDRLAILLLAYLGLRFGELAALRVRRVDLMRRRVEIAEAVTEVGGRLVLGTPKTHQRRAVALPRFIADDLAAHMAGKGPEDFVFASPEGGPVRLTNWRRRSFDPACRAAGLDGLTPHGLRHTAASLAISAGANVKDVQHMLGHASAAMTLDVYAGLFADSLDSVADRLDAVGRAAADSVRTGGSVSRLPTSLERAENVL